jgi:hypothetical protein
MDQRVVEERTVPDKILELGLGFWGLRRCLVLWNSVYLAHWPLARLGRMN